MKKVFLAILAILVAIIAICAVDAYRYAFAEAEQYYIICNPESFVWVRRTPKKGSEETGYVCCGDMVLSDEKTKNGYLHCIDLSTEYGEGWIHLGYIVADKPEIVDTYAVVKSSGRVAVRRWINGKRSSWIRDGTRVKVLAISDEWTLTVRGFIRTEFLEVE